MPQERIEQARRVARVVATYDEQAALTEVERAAIHLAREYLALADENERLRRDEASAKVG